MEDKDSYSVAEVNEMGHVYKEVLATVIPMGICVLVGRQDLADRYSAEAKKKVAEFRRVVPEQFQGTFLGGFDLSELESMVDNAGGAVSR
jgi:hypothetical protein